MKQALTLQRRAGAALFAALLCVTTLPALAAGTLEKARDSGKLTLGYRADARPFSYNDGGKPAGYSVALCQKVADAVKSELKLPELKVDVVPVTAANRFDALQQGQVDLLCEVATPTLARRAVVDFSIPIFQAGVGAVVRVDTARRVRDALAGQPDPKQPIWRAAPGALTENVVLAVVGGTSIEKSLLDGLKARRIVVTVAPVPDYATGLKMVLDGRAVGLFGDRPVLLDAASRGPGAGALFVVDRIFTKETLALALRRDDDAFRLLVDRTLSQLYRSKEIGPLFASHFGAPDGRALEFFESTALPD
jgi:polar amino acid transport system substrate-binding protein